MARTIPDTEPTSVVVGDSWEWDVTYSDYPASDGWQLSYALRGPADAELAWNTVVAASGDGFEVRVPAATTTTYTDGSYRLIGYVTDGTDRFTVYDAPIFLLPDPSGAVNALTQAEQDLAAVEAAIAGRITADLESYALNGRQVSKIPIRELYRIRNALRWEVQAQRSGRLTIPVEATFRAPR